MPNTEEQRLDIVKNCNITLQTILRPFEQTDDTPEGRMIAQLLFEGVRPNTWGTPEAADKLTANLSSREALHLNNFESDIATERTKTADNDTEHPQ